MSNNYDIELEMDICGYDYKPKKEKLKEIRANKEKFKAWVKERLEDFDDVALRMDEWMNKEDE